MKVYYLKKMRWQFRRIFRWLCRGVLHFFCRPCFHGEICKTKRCKMDATLKMIKSVHFVLQISPRKHGLQKKWSTPRRCQRKILRNCHLNFFIFETLSQSNVKNHDFIKKSVQFSIFLEHPLVYLIKYNKSTAQVWTNKKSPMHFGAS